MASRLGDLLLKEQVISKEQLDTAMAHQKSQGGRLGSILVALGYATEAEILTVLSRQYGLPSVELALFPIDAEVISLIPVELAMKYRLVPISRVGSTLTIATSDPTNIFAIDDLKFMTGLNVEPVVASEGSIREAIEKYYGAHQEIEIQRVIKEITTTAEDESTIEIAEEEGDRSIEESVRSSSEAPIIRLVNMIFSDALRRGASDIHIEPYEKEFRVRFRIDGILYLQMTPPNKVRDAVTSRIKIMAKMDISEKRLPQDGRIKVRTKVSGTTKDVDFRVSVLPTLFGEKIVIRVLDKGALSFDMERMGFEKSSLSKFETAIGQPYGMVLVTGPTGSGKTSTLYASINRLNRPEVNIMTAEDPVEFNFAGINQVQVREAIGLTFAAALRSFLRQDPNIILVGEIRDFETAEIAIKAALTGHLVLSTLHTNDAPSTITRLLNMGIEPFLVATALNLICAQRLIRKICTDCKAEINVPPQSLIDIGIPAKEAGQVKVFKGTRCKNCNDTGYRGRVGLFEVMEIHEEIQEMIFVGASARELRKKAIEDGMITLRQSGIQKIRDGLTTVEEVVRETVRI
ncbi:MAG: type IV-A pilus assembly ATPase PilB [Acidobacteria bacterium]|nr:type IV-A pilus assembly ATPase PilB [Acidobacteriota bacterium]MBI3656291.1 type IV-A pilus assembly ATPase PilB [Acidobacteriota bacterium]